MPSKPTGARPKPTVTPSVACHTVKSNATRPAVKHTAMGSPKRAATTKKKGGRSY